MSKLEELIAEQQKGHESEPRYMIGEQLKDMARRDVRAAELLERDLQLGTMSLEAAEKHFGEYADKNRGHEKVFCITPKVAERLLFEFYALPEPEENTAGNTKGNAEGSLEGNGAGYIDLSTFL